MFHQTVLDHLTVLAGAIPKVNTQAPPGSEKILSIVGCWRSSIRARTPA